jgi:hypothetical protein
MFKEYPKFNNYEVLDYGRKSRTDDPLLSVEEVLDKHDQIIREYAEKHLGGPITEENKYREVGSAESLDSRPEILRVLKAVENPAIKAVAVVEVQRLSRGDLEDAGRLIKILRYTNTYVITPMKTYDLRDEYDRDAFERELKRGNEYLEYYKKIQARGKLASVKEGNYLGAIAPYGYEKTTVTDGKKVCPTLKENKEEADVVRMIFNWYCNEDIGVKAICRRLEELGIKTRTGKPYWRAYNIFAMLENVHYIGCVRWNWRKTIKIIEDQEIKKLRPKAKVDEYLVFEGKHDAIIPKELFDKAQDMRGKRHRTKPNVSLKNPFSGLLFCKCGSSMGHNTFRRKNVEYAAPKLVCNNQVYCKSGSASFNEIYSEVCNVIRTCIEDFELRIKNDQDDSYKLHIDLVKRLERKLEELEKKEVEQWEAQYDPDESKRLPPHIFKVLNERVLKEKAEINKALCKAKDSTPNPVDYREELQKFTDALDALEDPEVDVKIKNHYLKSIIDRVEYERGTAVRLTKDNAHEYGVSLEKGSMWYVPPYKIHLKLKYK